MTALYQLVDQYRHLQVLEDPELPEEAVRDTLEGLEGEINVKATNVARFIANQEAFAEAVEEAAKAMAERAKRLRRRADGIRGYLLVQMQAAGIERIEAPEFTLAVRKNPPSVIVDSIGELPDEYLAPPPPPPEPKPDKKAIAAAIKAGTHVPGARLEQSVRLEIKQ